MVKCFKFRINIFKKLTVPESLESKIFNFRGLILFCEPDFVNL